MVKWPRLKGYFGVTFGRLNIEKIEIKDKTKIPEKVEKVIQTNAMKFDNKFIFY